MQIEWLGGWLSFDFMGPWPTPSAPAPVYVLLLGPLYISFFPNALDTEIW